MGLCCPLWPALSVICGNVTVCALGIFWNPILRRNRVVWDSYFHWLDVVLKGLIVLCHLIFRFSVTCLTTNNWVLCIGSVLSTWTHISFRWFSWHSFIISASLVIRVKSVLMRKIVLFWREIHLRNKRYFNQSWLDVDRGFTKSTDYQFATESQQMGYGNMYQSIYHYVFRRAKACGSDGIKLTAKHIKNLQSLSILSELMRHTSRWRICPWSHELVPYPV